jgi:hypothetical protein
VPANRTEYDHVRIGLASDLDCVIRRAVRISS